MRPRSAVVRRTGNTVCITYTDSISSLKLSVNRYAVTLVFKRLQNYGATYNLTCSILCAQQWKCTCLVPLIAAADFS